jgi:hypothetical protein
MGPIDTVEWVEAWIALRMSRFQITIVLNGPTYGFGRSLQAYAGTVVLPL